MKTSRQLKRFIKNESAQALVETMIVYPVVIFFILGIIQLTLMHQARLMLEYAAFNAARTGSVWNADPMKMRKAALLSMIASRPSWPGIGSIGEIKDYKGMAVAAATLALAVEAVGAAEDLVGGNLGILSVLKVDILSPTQDDVPSGKQEIDFDIAGDDFNQRRLGQLSIRVTYFYKLFIPFANWVIWNTWYAMRTTKLGPAIRDLAWANEYLGAKFGIVNKPFLAFDARNYASDAKIWEMILAWDDKMSNAYECITKFDWASIVFSKNIFGDKDAFYIPMITAHTIRMQSNHYKSNLPTADDVACESHN